MKRLLIACSLITAPLLLASSNESTNNIDTNNKIKQETIMNMTKNEILPGLKYETLKEGSGISPQKGKLVTVHYTGWLNNAFITDRYLAYLIYLADKNGKPLQISPEYGWRAYWVGGRKHQGNINPHLITIVDKGHIEGNKLTIKNN